MAIWTWRWFFIYILKYLLQYSLQFLRAVLLADVPAESQLGISGVLYRFGTICQWCSALLCWRLVYKVRFCDVFQVDDDGSV